MPRIFDTTSVQIAQKSLDALWLKQKVLANNLANIDTPGFKSRDVVFEDLLNATLKNAATSKDKLTEKLSGLSPKVVENPATQIRSDGNNVDVDEQSLELARVQLQYDYMTRSVADDLARMKYAINGGR